MKARVRETLAIAATLAPVCVSQHTAHVLGFKTGRAYLEWLVANGVPHIARGKDRLVETTVALEYLRRSAALPSNAVEKSDIPEEVDEADRVLAAIGRRRSR